MSLCCLCTSLIAQPGVAFDPLLLVIVNLAPPPLTQAHPFFLYGDLVQLYSSLFHSFLSFIPGLSLRLFMFSIHSFIHSINSFSFNIGYLTCGRPSA